MELGKHRCSLLQGLPTIRYISKLKFYKVPAGGPLFLSSRLPFPLFLTVHLWGQFHPHSVILLSDPCLFGSVVLFINLTFRTSRFGLASASYSQVSPWLSIWPTFVAAQHTWGLDSDLWGPLNVPGVSNLPFSNAPNVLMFCLTRSETMNKS